MLLLAIPWQEPVRQHLTWRASFWREGQRRFGCPANPSTTPAGVHQHRSVPARDRSRPELVKPSLIVDEEPCLCELPLSIHLYRHYLDDIKGLAVPFGGEVKEDDDVVVTGKDALHIRLRDPSPPGPGKRIHHCVSSSVRAAHGIVPGKVQDGIVSKVLPKVLPKDVQTAAVPRLKAPPHGDGIRMFSHC